MRRLHGVLVLDVDRVIHVLHADDPHRLLGLARGSSGVVGDGQQVLLTLLRGEYPRLSPRHH